MLKVFTSHGSPDDAFPRASNRLNNLHKMNDSCGLPRQRGSLGSFNDHYC